jgi:hypothetical protein
VLPSLKAARRRQRLLRDFDPGSVTVPSKLLIGSTVYVSAITEAIFTALEPARTPTLCKGVNALTSVVWLALTMSPITPKRILMVTDFENESILG